MIVGPGDETETPKMTCWSRVPPYSSKGSPQGKGSSRGGRSMVREATTTSNEGRVGPLASEGLLSLGLRRETLEIRAAFWPSSCNSAGVSPLVD